jgi:hypothetical protein
MHKFLPLGLRVLEAGVARVRVLEKAPERLDGRDELVDEVGALVGGSLNGQGPAVVDAVEGDQEQVH